MKFKTGDIICDSLSCAVVRGIYTNEEGKQKVEIQGIGRRYGIKMLDAAHVDGKFALGNKRAVQKRVCEIVLFMINELRATEDVMNARTLEMLNNIEREANDAKPATICN